MRQTALVVTLLAAATGLTGCKREKPAPPAPPPPRVTVVRPVSVPVRDYWTYNGYLESTKAVEVRSKVRGYLNAVKFAEGTDVEEGQLLYTIDKLEFNTAVNKADAEEQKAAADILKAEAEIKSWDAQIAQAQADLDRISQSLMGGVGTRTEEDKAKADLAVRKAEKKAAEAALNATKASQSAAAAALRSARIQLGYTDIKAKIGGHISRTHVDEGTLVLADTTMLTTILQVDKLYVYFDAPEADLIAYQQSVIASHSKGPIAQQIPVEVGVTREDGYPHVGLIDFRENKVETSTGTIRIRGVIDNPVVASSVQPMLPDAARPYFKALMGYDPVMVENTRFLFPGMYARVRVPRSEPVDQLVLPEDCLLSGQEGRFLYVIGADNKVEKRVVTVGPSVWKAPPSVPGVAPPSWAADNPKPAPPVEGQPPAPTRRTIRSVVAITAGLKADDRVILDGLQQARPLAPVNPEEWIMKPPAEKK